MIHRTTNGSKWGIKDSVTDFTNDIHSIIDNATRFIVVCGYNFSPYTHPTSIIPRLIIRRQNGVRVLVIAPPTMWGFGNGRHTGNIQYLVNNQIGVILNSHNHSKWILSDYGYYYGSLNFTASSMTTKVEVVSYCDSLTRPALVTPRWISETKNEFLMFAINELHTFNRNIATQTLGAANNSALTSLRRAYTRILRYNPSIEKIIITLNNYEEVRAELSSIIDNYLPIVSFSVLNSYWQKIDSIIYALDRLAYVGNDIFLRNETNAKFGLSLLAYNRLHTGFSNRITNLIRDIENSDQIDYTNQEALMGYNLDIEKVLEDYNRETGDTNQTS